ncbi:MAG: hypothetical protein H0T85_02320, partial [Geodermatophilaceae bacterium]|nr:hypothetical protein [Geodermatophilaceae bacterium]
TLLVAALTAAVAGLAHASWAAALSMPATLRDLLLGANAYGLTDLGSQLVPADSSDRVMAFHLAVYGVLSGATDRGNSVAGSVREFLVLAVVAGALALFLICRQLALGRFTAAAVVLAAYAAPAVAVTQALSPVATLGLTWFSIAGLLIAARPASPGLDRLAALAGLLLLGLAAVLTPVVLVPAAGVLTTALATGVLLPRLPRAGRAVLTTLAFGALVTVTAVLLVRAGSVPTLADGVPVLPDAGPFVVGATIAVVALAAAWRVLFVRPLAVGTLPLVAVVAVPSQHQPAAVVLGTALAALLLGTLIEELVTRPRRRAVRPSAVARVCAVSLTLVTVGGLALLPPQEATGSAGASAASVATWLQTYLPPERRVRVDDQLFVELIRAGVPATRFEREGREPRVGAEPAALEAVRGGGPSDLPVVARFGDGPLAVDVRLLVEDPAAFAEAQELATAAAAAFAEGLAVNPNIDSDDEVKAVLRSGTVDPRMLTVLATAAADYQFTLRSLTPDVGTETGGAVRTVEITDIAELTSAGPTTDGAGVRLRDFFRYQLSRFRPLSQGFDDGTLVVVYDAPSPVGLLP